MVERAGTASHLEFKTDRNVVVKFRDYLAYKTGAVAVAASWICITLVKRARAKRLNGNLIRGPHNKMAVSGRN